MPRLLCFGDSITYGAWDSRGGWVARVRAKVDKVCLNSGLRSYVLTYSQGISSDTSERLLERIDSEFDAFSKEAGDNLVIISIGTNDSIKNVDGSYWVELAQFGKNIRELIEKTRKSSLGLIFVGNMPVDENKSLSYGDKGELSSSNADIKAYDNVTRTVCDELNVPFISVFDDALENDVISMLCIDGIHPNDKGHEFIAEKVWAYLKDNSWIVE